MRVHERRTVPVCNGKDGNDLGRLQGHPWSPGLRATTQRHLPPSTARDALIPSHVSLHPFSSTMPLASTDEAAAAECRILTLTIFRTRVEIRHVWRLPARASIINDAVFASGLW